MLIKLKQLLLPRRYRHYRLRDFSFREATGVFLVKTKYSWIQGGFLFQGNIFCKEGKIPLKEYLEEFICHHHKIVFLELVPDLLSPSIPADFCNESYSEADAMSDAEYLSLLLQKLLILPTVKDAGNYHLRDFLSLDLFFPYFLIRRC
jgi:hypothetical protein